MPSPTRASRLPELHLPRLERDEIIQTLSEIRMPDRVAGMDLPRIEPPRIDLSDIELPSGKDIRRAVQGAAILLGLRRRPRPVWPLAGGLLIVAGITTIAVLRTPAVRAQLDRTTRAARERIARMRADRELMEAPPSELAEPIPPTSTSAAAAAAAATTGLGTDSSSRPVAVGPGEPVEPVEGVPAFDQREAANSI
jgi:hypothetical protein